MTENDCDEPPMAEDAIPSGAVWLTEAYSIVIDALELHPDKTVEIDEDWLDILRESREFEKTVGHDPETFDAEFEEFWHLQKVANIFLRCALENNELRACTRDPRTGETLQLPASGWLSAEWIARRYVPSGIWRDHAIPEDDEIPGPGATLISGQLRPIFFFLSEFEMWLSEVFGPDIDSESRSSDTPVEGERPRDAVKEAVSSLWGRPPRGVHWEERNKQINAWLRNKGCKEVAARTISRALAEMRGGHK